MASVSRTITSRSTSVAARARYPVGLSIGIPYLGTHAGTFVVESARREARRLRSEQTLFVVDQEQWAAFDQLLDRPAMDKPRLRALLDSPSPFER